MLRRSIVGLIVLTGLSPSAGLAQTKPQARPSQATAAPFPERAIRRDLPLTPMIRRAFAAGTRDSSGRPGPKYWQLWTEYMIEGRLEPATAMLIGRARVVIHNRSPAALRSVVLRLDQNLFTATVPRAREVREITGGMHLTRLSFDGQALDLRRPALAPALARTSTELPLPRPIAAGGSGTLEFEWHFRVPEQAPRLGSWGDSLYQVAQWYPRVSVFDDLRAGGWDTEPYLGTSEFNNNFGRFDVRLDLPAGWLVGATGVLQNPQAVLTPTAQARLAQVLTSDTVRTIVGAADVGPGLATAAGARLVWHFVADSVSDFAWAASRRYVWDATRATIPGQGAIPVHLLYLPGNAQRYGNAGAVVRHALEFYSRRVMPYAFPQLTMVDGPERGMEYPMLIMSGVGAADHEVGHQWWPMMVGVNETWYPFLDEGVNQYMNLLSDAVARGQAPNLDGLGQRYGQQSGDEREPPLMWNANYAGPAYFAQAYGKVPMMLSMLGGIVGDSAVQRALSEYTQAWRFKHPSPWDFALFLNRALGQDLGWFWYYWLFTTESVDGGIARVAHQGARTIVTVRQDGQMPAPVVLKVRFAPTGPAIKAMTNSTMLDSVTALVTYPVDVWFAGRRTFDAVLDFGGRPITQLTLDPAQRFPDRHTTDNVWVRPVER